LAKFLVFHPKLDIFGGAEKVGFHVIKTLVEHNQQVELLTFDLDTEKYGRIMDDILPEEVTVHSIEKRSEKPPFTIYKKHHNTAKLLKPLRKNLEYDFLFATQASSPFETVFLNKAQKNLAYVHFPEIHDEYHTAKLKRKIYLWLFKKWVENGVKKLDNIFCNSNYTKEIIKRYWGRLGIREPTVVYPPVDLDKFWCKKPLKERSKKVTYIGRFIPTKRHDLMMKLAIDFPDYEFVSIGGLEESGKPWFNRFNQTLPKNYVQKPNLSKEDLIKELQTARVNVHLMRGEHFGIAPIEALASGCVTIVHDSGGSGEFIPAEFRWKNYAELKIKISKFMEDSESICWEETREKLWRNISVLESKNFRKEIWAYTKSIIQQS
jgi:glycosyltransferase involved in cell wall biosynthesis